MPAWLRAAAGGILVDVLVQPRASRTEIAGVHGDRLKVRIAAPPVDGLANEELCRFLASALDLPRRQVTVEVGESSRRKTVRAEGTSLEAAGRVLPAG
jgi:hypothetical protein